MAEDVIIGWSALDTSVICTKLFAEGSTGSIDCDGGSAHDAELVIDSDVGGPPTVNTGLGEDAGAGAGSFTAKMQATINIAAGTGATSADCLELDYSGNIPEPTAYTTATFTTRILNAKGPGGVPTGGENRLSFTGENFDCDEFDETDSAGIIVSGVAGLGTIIGDAAQNIVLDD